MESFAKALEGENSVSVRLHESAGACVSRRGCVPAGGRGLSSFWGFFFWLPCVSVRLPSGNGELVSRRRFILKVWITLVRLRGQKRSPPTVCWTLDGSIGSAGGTSSMVGHFMFKYGCTNKEMWVSAVYEERLGQLSHSFIASDSVEVFMVQVIRQAVILSDRDVNTFKKQSDRRFILKDFDMEK